MINTFRTLPKDVGIAFSGGVDSVVLFHVVKSLKRNITLFTYDHLTETSKQELAFAQNFASINNVKLVVERQPQDVPKGDSKERYWSECRNQWFNKQSIPIATGHHLNDAAEWFLMTSLQGGQDGYLLDYQNKNVIRPLIIASKNSILTYATHFKLEYIHDETNNDVNFNLRNKVRHKLLPEVLNTFPGFLKSVRIKIEEKEKRKLNEHNGFL